MLPRLMQFIFKEVFFFKLTIAVSWGRENEGPAQSILLYMNIIYFYIYGLHELF